MNSIFTTKNKQYLAIGLLAVAGTAGLVTVTTNAMPLLNNDTVKAALASGDLNALKTALTTEVKTNSDAKLAKIDSLTDTDLQNIKTLESNKALIDAKNTEYETKLTNILKANIDDKSGFETTAKEYFDTIKTLREKDQVLRDSNPLANQNKNKDGQTDAKKPTPPEITSGMLDKIYTKAVTDVKAGKSVTLKTIGAGKMGHIGGRGMGMDRKPNTTTAPTSN